MRFMWERLEKELYMNSATPLSMQHGVPLPCSSSCRLAPESFSPQHSHMKEGDRIVLPPSLFLSDFPAAG